MGREIQRAETETDKKRKRKRETETERNTQLGRHNQIAKRPGR